VFNTLGLKPKEVVNVQINGANPPRPLYREVSRARMDAAVASSPPTPVEGGEQQVEASVTLQISY
jgi:uncharacterized protein